MQHSPKAFAMNVLNGTAIGVVTALISSAILGELLKAFTSTYPVTQVMLQAATFANSMLGVMIGVMVGYMFKFTPIQSGSIGLATMFAGGAARFSPEAKAFLLTGTGDIITMGITAAIAALLVLLIGDLVKNYSILVIPPLLTTVAGGAGFYLFPYIRQITTLIGQFIAGLLLLQPVIMCVLLSMIFCILILSPFTTVGIALAVSLDGIGAGAANLGICAAGIGFAIAGWRVNPVGTSLAHFLGSPKISMATFLSNPKTILPMLCTAALLGVVAAFMNVQGTPMSAGFGLSGLVGPIAALSKSSGGFTTNNMILIAIIFAGLPILGNLLFTYLFMKVFRILRPEDYRLNIQ